MALWRGSRRGRDEKETRAPPVKEPGLLWIPEAPHSGRVLSDEGFVGSVGGIGTIAQEAADAGESCEGLALADGFDFDAGAGGEANEIFADGGDFEVGIDDEHVGVAVEEGFAGGLDAGDAESGGEDGVFEFGDPVVAFDVFVGGEEFDGLLDDGVDAVAGVGVEGGENFCAQAVGKGVGEAGDHFGAAGDDEVVVSALLHDVIDDADFGLKEAFVAVAFVVLVVFAGPFASEAFAEFGAFGKDFACDGADEGFDDAGFGFGDDDDGEAVVGVFGFDDGVDVGVGVDDEFCFEGDLEFDGVEEGLGSPAAVDGDAAGAAGEFLDEVFANFVKSVIEIIASFAGEAFGDLGGLSFEVFDGVGASGVQVDEATDEGA